MRVERPVQQPDANSPKPEARMLRIALRYLFAPKSHSAVNIITAVSMLGITLATAALVVVLSVFNGFHALISERFSAVEPPLTAVAVNGKTIGGVDSLVRQLQARPEISLASPIIQERALAGYNGRQQAVRLRGISEELFPIFDSLTLAGEPWKEYYPGHRSAVVSVGVANGLEIPIGGEDLLEIYVPKRTGRINPANPMAAFRADTVAPSAVFAVNQTEIDADMLYVPLDIAAELLDLNDQATEIYIYPFKNQIDAKNVAEQILGPEVKVQTLLQREGASFQIVNLEKWMTFLLLGFILLIASFNIVSSLSLLIIEKEPNARMLNALGAPPSMNRRIYRLVGLSITAIGTLLGVIVGSLLTLGQQQFGWVKLVGDSSQLSTVAYPVRFLPADLGPVALLALLTGFIATLLATRKKTI